MNITVVIKTVMSCFLLIYLSWKFVPVLLIVWAYKALCPPSPRVCGSPGGPPIEAPRVKLRDGRHLAYKEHGVSKDVAKYKIIFVHGFGNSRHETSMLSSEVVEKLGIHMVSFDRPGYGQSDPDPNRTIKSTTLDIEELGDQLQLGPKFYIIGNSMGGNAVWGCLKYIPHRLAGVSLICPVVNYWWSGFPSTFCNEVYHELFVADQWALRVAHHAPWLLYWWNTQKWFPSASVEAGTPNFTALDLKLLPEVAHRLPSREYATQQGIYESLHRDMKIAFGKWEFSPMELDDPFPDGQGSVHVWHGVEDGMVPATLQHYIAKKLPWIKYHELPDAGHLFIYGDTCIQEAVMNTLLTE